MRSMLSFKLEQFFGHPKTKVQKSLYVHAKWGFKLVGGKFDGRWVEEAVVHGDFLVGR